MCGIVGAVDCNGRELPEDAVQRAVDVLSHRGPDDQGLWFAPCRALALGNRRLSIIDTSERGRQPMSDPEGSVVVTYNGEIYNHRELRVDLQERGYEFRSHSDTELLVHGYKEYGKHLVDRLRGIFAFVLYDVARRRLFVARDRLGVKPLYYARAGSLLVFASEIKSILEFPGIVRDIDPVAMYEYLAFGRTHAPRTMFKGIHKFPAACRAVVDESGILTFDSYWSPYDTTGEDLPSDERALAQRLLGLIEESVVQETASDRPIGTFLSGGVDSTAIVALMSRAGATGINTFTVGFQGQERYDERQRARAVADLFGTRHDEIEMTRWDFLDLLPELSWYLDEPVADPTVIPLFLITRKAQESGVPVLLSGDGMDELFCGYSKSMRYLRMHPYWKMINALPKKLTRSLAGIGRSMGVKGSLTDIIERSSRDVELYIGSTSPLKGMPEFHRALNGYDIYQAPREGARRFALHRRSNDYVEWLSYWGLLSDVQQVFLYRADRMGMANSVEVRVPFLDHRLVEFAARIPQELKHRLRQPKYLLKQALRDVVPHDILHRRKQGFCVPVTEWSGKEIHRGIALTLPRIRRETGLIDDEFVDSVLAVLDGRRLLADSGFLAWNLYMLTAWYARWF